MSFIRRGRREGGKREREQPVIPSRSPQATVSRDSVFASIIVVLLLLTSTISAQTPIPYDKCYFDSTGSYPLGLHATETYFRTITPFGQSDASSLGDVTAGYHLGRYILHGHLWYHLAWARSPEYTSAPLDRRLQLLRECRNKIDTMTTEPYFRDVSLCVNSRTFRGGDHSGITRWQDGYRGWGFTRNVDALMPLPSTAPRTVTPDTWFRVKIRVRSIPPSSLPEVSVWIAREGEPFTEQPWYRQTYDGRGRDEEGDPVLYAKGSVAILSCFSDISVRNLAVYRGTGDARHPFYLLNDHGEEYLQDPRTFHAHWERVGYSDSSGTDRDVWEVTQDASGYAITTRAAEGRPVAMDSALYDPWNGGVFAMALLQYTDGSGASTDDLGDAEIEYELNIRKRTTSYAEAGIGLRTHTKDDVPVDVSRMRLFPWTSSHVPEPARFAPVRHNLRYLGVNLRPDAVQIAYHLDTKHTGTGMFYWGTPWDTEHTLHVDSIPYAEGANSEGEMTGAVLRFAHYITSLPASSPERQEFQADADTFIARMNKNTVAKWTAATRRSQENNIFYGNTNGRTLLCYGDFDEGIDGPIIMTRIGGLYQYTRRMPAAFDAENVSAANAFFDVYVNELGSRFHPITLPDGRESWYWFDSRRWWDSYAKGFADRGHSSPEIRFLYLENLLGGTPHVSEALRSMADNFINIMWNRQTGAAIGVSRDQSGGSDVRQLMDDYPLLASTDWMVWEICNEYYQKFRMDVPLGYGNTAAVMVYAVKYAVPRRLRADTIDLHPCSGAGGNPDDGGSNLVIRWDPPSDYPCGYLDSWNTDAVGEATGWRNPGTTLQKYHIEIRDADDTHWSLARRHEISIPTFQEENKYPYFIDREAEPGKTYVYRVRTQDWSTLFSNFSDWSDTLRVTYPEAHRGDYPTFPSGLLAVQVLPFHMLLHGESTALQRAVYYAPFNVAVEEGAELSLSAGTHLVFGDSCELQVRGTLDLRGDADCDRIVLNGSRGIPGSWWGISLYESARHRIDHAVIMHAINNAVVFDEGGLITNSTFSGASQFGLMIRNGGGEGSQSVENCDISGNGYSNLSIYPGVADVSGGGMKAIFPEIRSCRISAARTGDGILLADRAWARIENCEITDNAGCGVRAHYTAGELTAGRLIRLERNRIRGNGSANVKLTASAVLARFNTFAHAPYGILTTTSSALYGATGYWGSGRNTFDSCEVALRLEDTHIVHFGLRSDMFRRTKGGGNVFRNSLRAHVESERSGGFLQCNRFEPDAPRYFDIPGYPEKPEVLIEPVAPCMGDGVHEPFTKPSAVDFAVWPNPAADHIFLRIDRPERCRSCIVSDILGRPLRTLDLTSSPAGSVHRISLAGLPAGVFVVTVYGDSGVRSWMVRRGKS
ncbi:MAG: right-handed parallel beta-helix repeat-containing protein [Bacteroidetes bacterium]|nr:right-handed parallel beta-helix repeat-containing protein [Bacteroidota bacterium]